MTALAIGSSVTVPVGDDGTVVVATNGGIATVSVSPVVGAAATFTIGPAPTRQAFGPYSEGATLALSNVSVGQMDYEAQPSASGLTPAEVAATKALVNRYAKLPYGGSVVWRNGTAPLNSSNITTPLTLTQSWRIPFDISGFRLGFENISATQLPPISLAKFAICGSAGNTGTQAIDQTANYHTSNPTAITFGGASGFTPGLRFGGSRPSAIQWSDWTPVTAADEGKTLVVRLLCPYVADWAYTYYPLSFSAYGSFLSQVINPTAGQVTAADNVTTNVSWAINSSNMNGNLHVPFLELMPKSSTLTVLNVAHFGDSITTGTAASGDPSIQPSVLACELLSTSTVKLIPMTRGYGGRTAAESYNLFLRYISDTRVAPNIVIWQVSSQNNGTSSAQYQATQGYILAVAQECRKIGAVLILQTAVPQNGMALSVDNARKVINLAARDSGYIVCDSDATLTDGGSPAAYLPAYGTGSHPTVAWYAADVAASFVPAIRQAAAVFGVIV